MQKINPAQAASLEEDLKNSRFPTLPMNLAKNRPDKYSVESLPFDSPRYTMGSPTLQVSPPTSSPTRRPDLMEMSQMSQPQQHPHRSSSITSTGSASTYEEEDEEEAYLAERARRVGGIRGIREGENITISYAGTAANRSGIRSLGALNLSKAGPQSGYPRMAYSLPHGLEAQAVYSLGNNSEFLSRPNSNNSERALYELNNSESGRSISLPTALPSHHWSSHPEESTSTTNASNSVSSVENIYHRDLTHYAGIPITSRQLKHFEMQQQRYLTEKYSHSLPDFPETHLSEGPEADSLSHIIDGIHISLPNIQESNDKVLNSNYYPRQAPPPPPPPPLSYTTSTARRNYHPIDMTIQNNPNYDTNNSHY